MTERTAPIASLRLHPDAAKVPMPDVADLRALRDSLRENGQQDALDVTADGVILDGRTRWTLLTDLGAASVRVRTADVPDHQQTGWIIERALARRHLTMAQKQALNALMRGQVIEVRPNSNTGAPMLIGHSQTERAAKLGVERKTVERWDNSLVESNVATSPVPTHAIDGRGRPQPLHKEQPKRPSRASSRPEPLRKGRPVPGWARHFAIWCRQARPEDREFMRRLDREVHAALDRNGIACEREVQAS